MTRIALIGFGVVALVAAVVAGIGWKPLPVESRPAAAPAVPSLRLILPGLDPSAVASLDGDLRAVVTPPAKRSAPVMTGERDGIVAPYLSVHREADAWTAYVHVSDYGVDVPYLARATSGDGLTWTRPVKCQTPPLGFGGDVVRRGNRWHYAYWRQEGTWYGTHEIVSDDGMTFGAARRIMYHDHDITSLSHDGSRWVLMYSQFPGGDQPRRSHWATSPDGREFATQGLLTAPAAWDQGHTQFYGVDGWITRGPYRIGLVKVMRDDVTAPGESHPGVGWTELIVSKSGGPWRRIEVRWLQPTPGAWDCTHAWADEQVVVGDTLRVYYGGYADGHKGNRHTSRSIGVAECRVDRYAALAGTGTVTLAPLPAGWGGSLAVDADGLRVVLVNGFETAAVDGRYPVRAGDVMTVRLEGGRLWSLTVAD